MTAGVSAHMYVRFHYLQANKKPEQRRLTCCEWGGGLSLAVERNSLRIYLRASASRSRMQLGNGV